MPRISLKTRNRKMEIPSFVFCGMSSTFSFGEDPDESSILDFINPICCRDQGVETIFRPMTIEESIKRHECIPPFFRDKSLLSAPSYCDNHPKFPPNPPVKIDIVPYDNAPSPNRQEHDATCIKQTDANTLSPIPSDFLPPRHLFSRTCEEKYTNEERKVPHFANSVILIDGLKPTDVLCGRGMNTSLHPGNASFKKVIKKHELLYICAKRSVKPNIALKLLEDFRRNSVRFVKRERDEDGKCIWVDIGEHRAYEKICQSLREGAPQLRRQMLASQALQRRQDSDTMQASSISSSNREVEEGNHHAYLLAKHTFTTPPNHSDSFRDFRFKDNHYAQNRQPNDHPRAMFYPPPASNGGRDRFLVE